MKEKTLWQIFNSHLDKEDCMYDPNNTIHSEVWRWEYHNMGLHMVLGHHQRKYAWSDVLGQRRIQYHQPKK